MDFIKKQKSLVTNLELSQKLKDLGIKQESYFYLHHDVYCYDDLEWHIVSSKDLLFNESLRLNKEQKPDNFISAFTVSELLEIIPKHIDIKQNEPFNNFMFSLTTFIKAEVEKENLKTSLQYSVNYICDTWRPTEPRPYMFGERLTRPIYDENPANALSKQIIFLAENDLIEIPK